MPRKLFGHPMDEGIAKACWQTLGETFNAPEAKAFRVFAIDGQIESSKQCVPKRENNGKILPGGKMADFVVMPEMNPGGVQDKAERAVVPADIGMVEMPVGRDENGQREKDSRVRAQREDRQPKKRSIYDHFQKMKSEISEPVHGDDTVMNLVNLPQPGNPMKEIVDAPLEKILPDQEENELDHQRILRQNPPIGQIIDPANVEPIPTQYPQLQ